MSVEKSDPVRFSPQSIPERNPLLSHNDLLKQHFAQSYTLAVNYIPTLHPAKGGRSKDFFFSSRDKLLTSKEDENYINLRDGINNNSLNFPHIIDILYQSSHPPFNSRNYQSDYFPYLRITHNPKIGLWAYEYKGLSSHFRNVWMSYLFCFQNNSPFPEKLAKNILLGKVPAQDLMPLVVEKIFNEPKRIGNIASNPNQRFSIFACEYTTDKKAIPVIIKNTAWSKQF